MYNCWEVFFGGGGLFVLCTRATSTFIANQRHLLGRFMSWIFAGIKSRRPRLWPHWWYSAECEASSVKRGSKGFSDCKCILQFWIFFFVLHFKSKLYIKMRDLWSNKSCYFFLSFGCKSRVRMFSYLSLWATAEIYREFPCKIWIWIHGRSDLPFSFSKNNLWSQFRNSCHSNSNIIKHIHTYSTYTCN